MGELKDKMTKKGALPAGKVTSFRPQRRRVAEALEKSAKEKSFGKRDVTTGRFIKK